MDINQTQEQTEKVSQAVATENDFQGEETKEVSLGKFKDVNALLNAYNSLQSEFTKRCQRVKELESKLVVEKEQSPTEKVLKQESANEESTSISDEDRQNIVKEYLKGILGAKQKAVVLDGEGGGINTPINKPKSIAEAGKLAQEILK